MGLKLGDKIYVSTDQTKAKVVRQALELAEEVKERVDVEKLDKLAAFVVEVYAGQFTVDELYENLSAEELYPTLYGTIVDISNGVMEHLRSKKPYLESKLAEANQAAETEEKK